jgi:hypothetical protein
VQYISYSWYRCRTSFYLVLDLAKIVADSTLEMDLEIYLRKIRRHDVKVSFAKVSSGSSALPPFA